MANCKCPQHWLPAQSACEQASLGSSWALGSSTCAASFEGMKRRRQLTMSVEPPAHDTRVVIFTFWMPAPWASPLHFCKWREEGWAGG